MKIEEAGWIRTLSHSGIVFIGGSLGSLCRASLSLMWPSATWPWSTLTVNICGSFLLGFFLSAIPLLHAQQERKTMLRLCIGTGFLGGFTTYSAFIVDAYSLAQPEINFSSISYVLVSVVGGMCCALGGIKLAESLKKPLRG